ncbi:hypothetical protein PDIG_87770 [Penicillium digitatum PHI26]|uniref:Uncharacterized protein n=2 Tax=Penicillium digitatum TaxID=36651 RepID=K9F9D6_PEND2|nr:hypothetical protein PDIP_33790 [Penicillium digitatum Pd1]EKV04692.1 hypothetical protein PDIG_87770 [Penicillium digitatum PHI26]EKV16791.1 hypothetical protein PDIP_33790 [Penicillium digitatum Pd1]KAG0160075.1 hypothetical protein PDIDSM_7602 [Penicillium digitatum]
MPSVFPYLQDKLLDECRIFKTNLDVQVHILQCDPDDRGKKRIKDVSRAVVELSVQTDRIINIALDMVAGAPDSEIIRRNTAFWSRGLDGHYKFEDVFLAIEHDLVNIMLALKNGPCDCYCADIAGCLDGMARKVSFHLNV